MESSLSNLFIVNPSNNDTFFDAMFPWCLIVKLVAGAFVYFSELPRRDYWLRKGGLFVVRVVLTATDINLLLGICPIQTEHWGYLMLCLIYSSILSMWAIYWQTTKGHEQCWHSPTGTLAENESAGALRNVKKCESKEGFGPMSSVGQMRSTESGIQAANK